MKETIPEHKNIIDDEGKVWWGWWNKPGETVPTDTFSYLINNNDEFDAFLIDSGTERLYKAVVEDIEWTVTERRRSTRTTIEIQRRT